MYAADEVPGFPCVYRGCCKQSRSASQEHIIHAPPTGYILVRTTGTQGTQPVPRLNV